jgi:hypothetical protein
MVSKPWRYPQSIRAWPFAPANGGAVLRRQPLPERGRHVPATYSDFVVYFAMPRAGTEGWRSIFVKKNRRVRLLATS